MGTVVRVEQGEHLASIAEDQEHASFTKIWNHADNTSLRQRRETPHLLLPGDEISIPETKAPVFRRSTGEEHVFKVNLPPLRLRVKLFDAFGEPVKDTDGELSVEGTVQAVRTDGDATVDVTIPYGTRRATLTLGNAVFDLQVGHLDPVDEPSGQQARLLALGYFTGAVIESATFEQQKRQIETSLTLAWELFQDENDLEITGVPNAESVDKLREVYGC